MLNFLFLFILTVQKEKKTSVNCKVKKRKKERKRKRKLLAGLGRTISRQNIMGEREEKVNDMHYWQKKKKRIKSQKYLLLYTPIKCLSQNLVSQARSLIAEASD